MSRSRFNVTLRNRQAAGYLLIRSPEKNSQGPGFKESNVMDS